MAKYRSEVHLYYTDDRSRPDYVWDGKEFVLPANDNAKRFCFIGHAKKAALELNRSPMGRHPAMQRRKYQAIAIDLDAPKPEPSVPVTQAAEAEIEHYMPSNGTEGYAFTSQWCDRCERDIEENCEILARSLIGDQPDEWRYLGGKPNCTAWQERTTPPEPEPEITLRVEARKVETDVPQHAKSWSAEMAIEPVANAIAPVAVSYPWSTPKMQHRGYQYWIAGDPGNGKNARYWYFIAFEEDGELIRTFQSDDNFDRTTAANQAARSAINRLSGVHLEVHA